MRRNLHAVGIPVNVPWRIGFCDGEQRHIATPCSGAQRGLERTKKRPNSYNKIRQNQSWKRPQAVQKTETRKQDTWVTKSLRCESACKPDKKALHDDVYIAHCYPYTTADLR